MFGFDHEDAHRRIDDWQATLLTRAARAEQLAAQARTLRAEGTDPDRVAQATVDHHGRLVELTISERARGWPMSRVAEAARVAVTMAQEAVVALTRHAYGVVTVPNSAQPTELAHKPTDLPPPTWGP